MNRKYVLLLAVIMIAGVVIAAFSINTMNNPDNSKWNGYEAEWKTVDSLEGQGLPKSALDAVEIIYAYAKAEANQEQLIKSIIHKAKYISLVEEEEQIKAIELFTKEIESSTGVTKSILQNMLGEIYWMYYQNNRWMFANRTTTVDFKNDDIRTWDIATLHKKTYDLYVSSIADREALKKVKINVYDDILIKGDEYGNYLRPTVYDFLAHRTLDFLMNEEVYVAQPAYAFTINNPVVFGSNKAFAGYQFSSEDTASKKLLALRVLQDLTLAHLYDPSPAALIDIDIKRLSFAKSNSVLANTDSLYYNALVAEEKLYIRDSSSARISHLIALEHYARGTKYAPLVSDEYKWEMKTAVEICSRVITQFPNSIGAINCAALKNNIEQKDYRIEAEQINIPETPFRVGVEFQNVDTLHLKLIKVLPEEMERIAALEYDVKFKEILNRASIKEWTQPLPVDGDYQKHFTEIKVDGLPLGYYFLIASDAKSFTYTANKIVAQEIIISNLSYIFSNNDYTNTGNKEIYVLDRTSGKPIKGADIETFKKEYDYEKRVYKYTKLKKYTTDQNGLFVVNEPMIKDYYYFSFNITNGKDFLQSDNSYYIYNQPKSAERPVQNTYFFTDRAIYRPGQTIYFKGILVESTNNGRKQEVLANKNTKVIFYDVNSQVVASLNLTTNNYGSFSGTFTAPASGLTGQMHIQNETGSSYFSVEEYKRPTFSVTADPVTGDYVLGDSVTVSGKAISYAGANIDNAKVSYRIVRNTSYPYFYYNYYYWKNPMPSTPSVEIKNGIAATDAEGKYSITFDALADLSANKKLLPQFTYTVYIDITDVSGETRSTQSYVSLGYTSVNLFINSEEKFVAGKNVNISISTNNLNGSKLKASGKVTLYAVEEPKQLLRSRIWQQPDVHIYSKAEYNKLFPHDLYANENDMYSWKLLGSVLETNWDNSTSDSLQLNTKNLEQGVYKMVVTTIDKSGETISIEKYITILNEGSYAAAPSYLINNTPYKSYQPGDNAVISFGSSAVEPNVLLTITRSNGTSAKKWITIPSQKNKNTIASVTDIEIPITEDDRGGISTQICFVKDGRFYFQTFNIDVPWTNKQLTATLETHRDKLQPGAQETWKIKISGNGGEKVAAELLASMYDASLDAFTGHYWGTPYWPGFYTYNSWAGAPFSAGSNFYYVDSDWGTATIYADFRYDQLNWFGIYWGNSYRYYGYADMDREMVMSNALMAPGVQMVDMAEKSLNVKGSRGNSDKLEDKRNSDEDTFKLELNGATKQPEPILAAVATRTNLNETAFFYPHLETDADGNIAFTFTMPEALTTWNFKAFAHTTDMQSAQILSSVITQKELMIQPNAPRFMREGDEIIFTAKVSNLTDNTINGKASLELYDAFTMKSVNAEFDNNNNFVDFSATKKGSTAVSWKLKVPEGIDAIVYKVRAASEAFTDGEENAIPILSNRILVTESLPLWVRGNQAKTFSFDRLIASGNSSTIRNQSLTLEYTSNPAWYAVQALPYMMEYPHECAEQVFSRYYSNSIAYHIANSNPEIKRVFDTWKNNPSSLTSNLEKNQELKQLLLEETPWVLQAQNETERKKRVALLFDMNKMDNELKTALNKLEKMQLPNGGWPWFKGYSDDRYITQYIVTGMAHLKQLGVLDESDEKPNRMLYNAIQYCNARMLEDYNNLIKYKVDLEKHVPSNLTLQYLYGASYFDNNKLNLSIEQQKAADYYKGQIKKFWTSYSLYEKGMIALVMSRSGESTTANAVVKSLKEYSLSSEEMGMYWKDNIAGYYWYQAPIETHALMIEVFGEVTKDAKAVEDLKVWLLRQKQTTDWKTTRATAEACYALLLRGTDLLADKELAMITVGRLLVKPESVEAGTGYFKTNWLGNNFNADFGKVSVTPSANNSLSYGAMYWQYFEDIDKVTASKNNLQINKQLFLNQNTATGPVIKPITDNTELAVGDLITVRIEIRVDRNMEYVHMKDMRASGFEPVNVLSTYKYQGGLGYYEATGDAATNFFISYLTKGTYVFEYKLRATHSGNFSNGITTIQCMYAPEFTSHSEGVRVKIK